MKYSQRMRLVATMVLASFSWMAIHPNVARAYNPTTHRNIADWAFQIMRGASLQEGGGPFAITPACTADPQCKAAFELFMSKVLFAPQKLDKLPVRLCDNTRKPLRDAPHARDANGDGRCQEEDDADYDTNYPSSSLLFGSLQTEGKFTGNQIGYQAAHADYEFDDWHTTVGDLQHFVYYGLAYLLTGFDGNAAREFANAIDTAERVGKTVISAALVFALCFLLLPAFFFMSFEDQGKLFNEIKDFASHLANIDRTIMNVIPRPENLGIGFDSGTLVGLGHFINTSPVLDGMPSHDFDDLPGKHRCYAGRTIPRST